MNTIALDHLTTIIKSPVNLGLNFALYNVLYNGIYW